MNFSSLLSQMSIRKQILMGFFPVLFVLIVLALTSHGKLNIFLENFNAFSKNAEENILFLEIERDINELERSVLAYSYIGYSGVLKKIQFLETSIDHKFSELQTIAIENDDISSRFDRLFGHYVDYKVAFKAATRKRQNLTYIEKEKLSPNGADIDQIIDELVTTNQDDSAHVLVDSLGIQWLKIRKGVGAFQISFDSIKSRDIKNTIKNLKHKIDVLISDEAQPLSKEALLRLKESLNKYSDAFNEREKVNRIYLHLINVVLAGKAAEIDILSRELNGFAEERARALQTEVLANNKKSQTSYLILSLIAGVVGIGAALLIANGISRPVQAMAGTLSRLASGFSDTDIPGRDRQDEIGEMAEAANEFKNMALELDEQRQQVEDSQVMLSAVVDNVVDGLITIDKRGNVQTYNNACEIIFGHKAKDVIGQNVKMLMPDPYQREHDQYLENYHQTKDAKIIGEGREVFGKKKNGKEFPMELSVSEITIRGERIYAGIVRDISERKKSQDQVKEALNFQNLISENIPDFIFVKDSEFRIVQANPAFIKMYPKNKRDQVIGFTTLEEYPEDEAQEFLKFDRQALEEGYSETEEIITFPNGDVKTLFTKKVRFENIKGEAFILGLSRDISESKKAEKEIIRSNEELERFAYIASHDLQEPLRMVSNFTALLNEEYGADMDETARQYMDFSVDASIRMQALITDLLEYSRAGEDIIEHKKFNAKDQIDFALKNLQGIITDSNATIIVDEMPEITAHPMRFARLMQNIIGNGLKYRDPEREPEIKISVENRKKEYLFSISDNGIGIKKDYLQQIFVIFKRLHHKQEYSGTGLGLAICKKIVESFEGQLWVESEFGKGSTFYFTLPKHN